MKFYKIEDQIIISDKALSIGTELIANTVDAAQEKHVPVITINGDTVKVALMGGSISGLSVQAFGLLGLILISVFNGDINADITGTGFIPLLHTNPTIMRLTTYSLGCSLVAMFNRVAGGNYTKAADISADIVAKVRHSMPEDDSRMPNTIADFIGDNVNDIAGNCSDLLESFVATMSATIMIAVTLYQVAVHKGLEIAEQAEKN